MNTILKISGLAAVATFAMSAPSASEPADGLTNASMTSEITIEASSETEVMGAVAYATTEPLIPVMDEEGRLFYNKIVEPEELPVVNFDLDVEDVYTFEHNGRTYRNKIVTK